MALRCGWVPDNLPIYTEYHDLEWGVPVHDDRKLFEMLVLEGAQAGLSWLTVLRKRARYLEVFDHFRVETVASYGPEKIASLLQDPGIIRNRAKVTAAVSNARAALAIQQEFGSLDAYLWRFLGGKPIQNTWRSMGEIPTRSQESDSLSKDLQKRGFHFAGSTICYAFMQAVGMVNDHEVSCFRYQEVQG